MHSLGARLDLVAKDHTTLVDNALFARPAINQFHGRSLDQRQVNNSLRYLSTSA